MVYFHFRFSLFLIVLFVKFSTETLVSKLNKDGNCKDDTLKLRKRSISDKDDSIPDYVFDEVHQKMKWNKKLVTYRIAEYTEQLTKDFIDSQFDKAFKLWEEHIDLEFIRSNNTNVDIEIRFCRGHHGDTMPFREFDMAHAFSPGEDIGGDIHLNDNLTIWHDGTTLLHTAAHEIGHAIGLFHIPLSYSIMSPYQGHAGFKVYLALEDIRAVQALYGKKPPKVSHHPVPPPPPILPVLSFTTETPRTIPPISTTTSKAITTQVTYPNVPKTTLTTTVPSTTVKSTLIPTSTLPTTFTDTLPFGNLSDETIFPEDDFLIEPDFYGSGDIEFNTEISNLSDETETTESSSKDLYLEEEIRNYTQSNSNPTTLKSTIFVFILSMNLILRY